MSSAKTTKKVIFLITKANWGGAQRYVYDLATNLNKAKFDCLVITGENGALTESLHHQQISYQILPHLNNSLSIKDLLVTGRSLYKLLRNEKPQILHVNSSVAGGLGALIGRIARVPRIIFTAHGWAFNEERPFFIRHFFRLLHYITVLLSHRTIAVSNAIIKQLDLPGVDKKMKVLHPGRTIGFMYEKEEARATLTQDFPFLFSYQKDIWIGTVAELHPIKQHDVLISSFIDMRIAFPTARLIIIGAGKEHSKLEKLIHNHGLEEHVFLLGAIQEAARLLKAFDIFALASHSEAYGYVLHEAGLAKLPTVATNVGGIPEIITHEVNGLLVPEKNPTAFTTAFCRLLSDQTFAQRLAEAHFTKMQERNLEKMIRATEALYTL